MRNVLIDVRCKDCSAALMTDEQFHSGEVLVVGALLEDHYCTEEGSDE